MDKAGTENEWDGWVTSPLRSAKKSMHIFYFAPGVIEGSRSISGSQERPLFGWPCGSLTDVSVRLPC